MNFASTAIQTAEYPADFSGPPSEDTNSPTVAFLSAAVLLMSGVMTIDGITHPQEDAHLQVFLEAFIQPNPFVRLPVNRILAALDREPCLDPKPLLQLTRSLDLSQRLLLLGLGYGMAMADGAITFPEMAYLRAIAQRLKIPTSYAAILESGFTDQMPQDFNALMEVASLVDPALFHANDPLFLQIANHVHAALAF
jgi:uncharacterized tellurite resistance protein B-like protein